MLHPLLAQSEFRGPALTALHAAFESVCRELKLNPRRDRLTDIVAETVLECARAGTTDPKRILACAERALKIKRPG
jgi:hypothetical protein